MSRILQRDLDYLKKELMIISSMVEDAIHKALVAVFDRRVELAREVIKTDDRIDEQEVHVEEECLKVLALHQPVAGDLRFIIAVLKVNNDLERMGDLAANIAERALALAKHSPLDVDLDLPHMAEHARKMVRDSLDAITNLDTELAWKVMAMDDEIDTKNREAHTIVQEVVCKEPAVTEPAVLLLSVSRHLERIADLATNIAEDVIYLVEGELVRHRTDDFPQD
jgi:phosphate transport system protein